MNRAVKSVPIRHLLLVAPPSSYGMLNVSATNQRQLQCTLTTNCADYRPRSLAKQGNYALGTLSKHSKNLLQCNVRLSVCLSVRPSVCLSCNPIKGFSRESAHKQTDGHTDGHYQVHYLPVSRWIKSEGSNSLQHFMRVDLVLLMDFFTLQHH